ncbi:hypothetical protein QY702_04325 [Xanthomonas campestris pv. plantaginis]|uniref:hypothetical protein n=1 Tax=Xanthomonas campestris TaxID=339 RepID=UPI002B22C674|nr:hypothetical protein [Xanthomonas campestris]MEA9605693.1 hypothetical protein [Xanthomonas campestris pv. plantaginis]
MHLTSFAVALGLFAASAQAFAGDPSTAAKFGQSAVLHQETSAAGETLDQFVLRIAPRARAASISVRAIVCGEILGNGPYSLTLKTDGYTDDCTVPKTAAPYVLVNGIARDAREDHFTLTLRFRPGYLITPWSIKYQDRNGVRKVADIER